MKEPAVKKEGTALPDAIGSPAARALALAGIDSLEGLVSYSEREIRKFHGVGPKAVRILKEAMNARGLAFASDKNKK